MSVLAHSCSLTRARLFVLSSGHAFSNVLTMLLRIVPRVAMHEGMRIEFLKVRVCVA